MKSILFTPGNVKAILDDLKWQTRREIKPQPPTSYVKVGWITESFKRKEEGQFCWGEHKNGGFKCFYARPRYKVGDIVYVKEPWCLTQPFDPETYYFGYKFGVQPYSSHPASEKYDYSTPDVWKSPLFMPEEAARLFLKITNVRVEKLQDISEQDAIAEGIQKHEGGYKTNYRQPDAKSYLDGYEWTAQESYQTLWESINGPGSLDLNPWVFAYDFKRVEKPQ